MIARALRALADLVDPPTFGPSSYNMKLGAAATETAFIEDRATALRTEHTMRMLDEETLGYMLLLVRRDHHGARIEPFAVLRDEAWPAVGDVMARLCLEADRMKVGR